jgi:hypothetical protein
MFELCSELFAVAWMMGRTNANASHECTKYWTFFNRVNPTSKLINSPPA